MELRKQPPPAHRSTQLAQRALARARIPGTKTFAFLQFWRQRSKDFGFDCTLTRVLFERARQLGRDDEGAPIAICR